MYVNLIPAARLRRTQARLHMRRWWTGVAGYAMFLVIAYGVALGVRASDDRMLQTNIEQMQHEIAIGREALITQRKQRTDDNTTLRANRAVGIQPDWSTLLALVGEMLDDDLVLRQCQLTSMLPSPRREEREERVVLVLAGLGRSQQAVSQFVLRLDSLSLFQQVQLTDTRREPFLENHAVAFRLECSLETSPQEEEEGA